MKNLLTTIVLLCLATAAHAQNLTTVTASNLLKGGVVLSSGQICFTGTDANDNPIPFRVGGGGQEVTFPYCATVTNGAIVGTFQVANPANTAPANISYRVELFDQYNRLQKWANVQFTGATFNFDNYVPSANLPLGVSANVVTIGNLTVTGSCTGCGGGGGGGGGGYSTIQNAGSSLAQRLTLNFLNGITCADNSGQGRTDCQLSGNVPESVTNDANVTGSISSNVFTLGWTGTLAKSRTLSTTVYTDQANTYGAGQKQTFMPSGTTAGFNHAGVTTDPSILSAGDVWFRSDLEHLFWRDNASTTHKLFDADDSLPTSQLSGTVGNGQLANSYSGVGACSSHQWASTLNGNAAPACSQPGFSDLSGSATTSQLPGAGTVTVNGALCTLASSCSPYGGANVYTASHTVGSSDIGKLVVMNCSSSCTLTFKAAPASTDWFGAESIGSTLANLSLNSLTYNGSSSVPVLNSYRDLRVWSDGSNYFGDAPLVAGTNVTLTPASNGLTVAASGGGSSLTARDGLQNNGGNLDFYPLDSNIFVFTDDFVWKATTSTPQPWIAGNSGSGSGPTGQQSTWPHLGVIQLSTGATSGSNAAMYLSDNPTPSASAFGALGSNAGWEYKWIFQLGGTTSEKLYCGMVANNYGGTLPPANWIGLRYDTSLSDSNFMFTASSSSAVTATSSTVAADTSWHTVDVSSTSAGSIVFTIDGAHSTTISTNVPTNGMTAWCQLNNTAAQTDTLNLDFFGFKARGLGR